MLLKLIYFALGVFLGSLLAAMLMVSAANPWSYLDHYGDQTKIIMCDSYYYGSTGVGKLFNELARENEPAGTRDELEDYLEEKCS